MADKSDSLSRAQCPVEYLLIGNIPKSFHSSDLRVVFSHFIEKNAFQCFHYRHRPEEYLHFPQNGKSAGDTGQSSVSKDKGDKATFDTCCCIVKIFSNYSEEFIKYYNQKHWSPSSGESMRERIKICRVKLKEVAIRSVSQSHTDSTMQPKEVATNSVGCKGTNDFSELNPPHLMPMGNVGTSTAHFTKLINSCKLPTKVISKLKLKFPKSRTKRRYGAVPLDYDSVEGVHEDGYTGVSESSQNDSPLLSCENGGQDEEDAIPSVR